MTPRPPVPFAEASGAPAVVPVLDRLVLPGRFRAAVFDLDGLLLDTEPMWEDAERELLERHGQVFTDADREASHGRAMAESAAAYAPRLGLSLEAIEAEVLEIMLAHYVAGPPLLAGVRELITALDGRIALAIASNTTAPLVRRGLASVGLDVFGVVASGADIGRSKPLPDVFAEACRLLGVTPSDAVGFDDSPKGIRAAVAAGLTAVGVTDRADVDLAAAGAHLVIASLAEVVVAPPGHEPDARSGDARATA